jgi:quercetin dioxygenase-like cupin family protein
MNIAKMKSMEAELIDALAGEGPGPVVGRETEDLNATLLSWPKGHEIAAHVNAEVDVIMVVFAGNGVAETDGVTHELAAGNILVIPKGAERSVRSLSDDFRYLNVHKRRRRLQLR